MKLDQDLTRVVESLDFQAPKNLLSIPEDPKFGDYSTNVALQLSKQDAKLSYQSAREIADDILEKLGHLVYLERVEIAGPGFINFWFKDSELLKNLEVEDIQSKSEELVIVEYADTNTHKSFHIGHVRTLSLGESIARLLEHQGKKVVRTNYGSDIGPTVAKALWGVMHKKEDYEEVRLKSLKDRADFLGKSYAFAHKEYESNEEVKKEIDGLTKKLYLGDKEIIPLWEETKQWSYAYFDTIYSQFGVEFDRVIGESEVVEEGTKLVMENLGKIFVRENGAVIFPGEKYGLHTRVFLTSNGNPTYEAKELGLTRLYQDMAQFDEMIILSHNEQIGFFKVAIKAMELIDSSIEGKKKHLSYGTVGLPTGRMASRQGNVLTVDEVLEQVRTELSASFGKADEKIVIGSIKFTMLKFAIASDITFDVQQSVSLQGDSGPYVQYTYARTCSLLEKSHIIADREAVLGEAKQSQKKEIATSPAVPHNDGLKSEERNLLRLLEYFGLIVEEAADNFEPNKVANYLLELCRAFNLFYQTQAILGSEKESFRLNLTKKVGETIKEGLYLLGIEAPIRM